MDVNEAKEYLKTINEIAKLQHKINPKQLDEQSIKLIMSVECLIKDHDRLTSEA